MNVVITTKQHFLCTKEFVEKILNPDLHDEEVREFQREIYRDSFFQSMQAESFDYHCGETPEEFYISRRHQSRPETLASLKRTIGHFVRDRRKTGQTLTVEIADDDFVL